MRISDWSSDVCSSDLAPPGPRQAQSDAPVLANASPRARISRRALLLPAGHRHLPDQDRAGVDVRTRVDVAAHRLDVAEHRLEVAGDGDAVDGVREDRKSTRLNSSH